MRRERLPPGGRHRVLCSTTILAVLLRALGESICSGAVVHKLRWLLGTCSIRGSYFFYSNAHCSVWPPRDLGGRGGERQRGGSVSMAEVSGQGLHFSYETAGDGFPLVLAPGPQGVWSPYIPLLGELCRTIIYTGHNL